MAAKHYLSCFLFLALFPSAGLPAYDGGPADLGPTDVHEVSITGLNQPILVIYVQANDYPILAAGLVARNNSENQKVDDFSQWFPETSWNELSFDVTKQRAAGGNWYVLPEGILDYASPSLLWSMEFRDAAEASAANPTPPASVTVSVGVPGAGDPVSDFDATEAGDYWYAVSGFRNGTESTLTRIAAAATVAENEIVKLTITKAAADDVDRYIVYRTRKDFPNTLGNYFRIGYAAVTAATDEYVDTGTALALLANHRKLLTDAMTAADADVADFENYNGVIVILHSSFLRGQAAQAATYTVNGTSFMIQTINQSFVTPFGRFTHEMGHWIALPDQYDPVTAAGRGYWTTMDASNDRQYATWEKEFKLGWISNPANVKYLERPGPGLADFDDTFKVVPTAIEETAADTYTAIKIKSAESVHYYVEGRDAIAGNISDAGADNKVVVMEAVDVWPPGIYPKRNLNQQQVLNDGSPTYSPDPTVEITYAGINAGPPTSYNVHVKIKAQERPDPRITPWNAPPWESTDIWIDSAREGGGWDDPATAAAKPSNGEAAWVDHVNRVYAKISNVGPGDATGVTVRFRVNTPGGIGGSGQFVDLTTPPAQNIPAGDSRNFFAEWTPTVGAHTCIKVEIEHVPGEESIYNNFAQENVNHFYSGSASPWQPVAFPVRVANPFPESRRVDLEIRGLQAGWKAQVGNKWVELEPKTFKTVNVTITPPPDADRCTRLELDLYGLTRIDDFIQVYGGMNPIIHLANPIEFQKMSIRPQGKDPDSKPSRTKAGRLYRISGATSPVLKQAEIAVIVSNPAGQDEVHFTTSNDNGVFQTTFPANDPGTWTAYTYYAGDDCNAPTESTPLVVEVPAPGGVPWWCCFLVIILLLFILALLLRNYRKYQAG